MRPYPASRMCGRTARMDLKMPVRLVSTIVFQASSVVFSTVEKSTMPWLASRMSIRPNWSRVRSTAAWTWAVSRASTRRPSARRSWLSTSLTVSASWSSVAIG